MAMGKDRRESDAAEELLQGEQGLPPGSSGDDRKPAKSSGDDRRPRGSSGDDR